MLLRSSCFFRASTFFCYEIVFQNNNFAAAVTFSEQLLFQVETSTEQPPLENKEFLRAVTATFLTKKLFRIKISTQELLLEAGISAQHQVFQKSYTLENSESFRKKIFHATHVFWKANFFKRRYLLYQLASFSKELLFYNILFQKSNYFTATLPFQSYTCYFSVSN